jgi:hypothetical protein
MTTPELERRLAGLLQERAEDAMDSTDTREQLSIFEEGRRRDRPGRRARWGAGALVAAAATVVGLVLWVGGGEEDRTGPAGTDGEAAALASSFLEAMYAPDPTRAEQLLASGVHMDGTANSRQWRREHAWHTAAGFSLAEHTCRTVRTSGTESDVECEFAIHALGSEQLGRGPFEQTLDVTVADGKVVSNDVDTRLHMNGFASEAYDPFAQWVARRHFADLEVMFSDMTLGGPRSDPRSLRLWEQRLAEYVESQR